MNEVLKKEVLLMIDFIFTDELKSITQRIYCAVYKNTIMKKGKEKRRRLRAARQISSKLLLLLLEDPTIGSTAWVGVVRPELISLHRKGASPVGLLVAEE